MKRWIRRWRNRRAYFKAGHVYIYIFHRNFPSGAPYSDALDILIDALETLNAEYNAI